MNPSDSRDRKRFVPLAERWIAAGITSGQMLRALELAEAQSTEPIAYLPAYVDRVLAGMQAHPRASPASVRDAETAEFLGRLTGGLAGTKPERSTVDVESAHVRRIA